MSMTPYRVRVDHVSGFFSFYDIEALHWNYAEQQAEQRFKKDFCNSGMPLTMLSAFTIDKHNTHYKNQNNPLTAKPLNHA